MKFTTERIIPDQAECGPMLTTHLARYRLAEPLVQNKVVLDAGCGCGYGTNYLAASGAKRAIGVDISPEAIEYARQHYCAANLAYERMDVTALDFPDETFDAVVCLEIFEHLANQRRLLAEVQRVLRPSGRVIVSTPNGRIFSPRGRPINPWHTREFSRDEFEELLGSYFGELELWGQTVKKFVALPTTLFHLRVQRYITTRDSWLSRLTEIGYGAVRRAAMSLARMALGIANDDATLIARADELPDHRTWYFIAVGRKVT